MRTSKCIFIVVISVLLCLCGVHGVGAKVSSEEAKQLKNNLTPFGAERAGNEEGTIPEWTGGITAPPEGLGYKGPGTRWPDPYAGDKVLFSITAKNIDQYADKVTEGQKALLRKYPDTYRLDVYPTHRSFAAPQWIYDNTYENAVRTELGENNNSVSRAFGGIPFPIPKSAEEVIWNHHLRWQGQHLLSNWSGFAVQTNGNITLTSDFEDSHEYMPYYNKEFTVDTVPPEYRMIWGDHSGPARRKGEILVYRDPLDFNKKRRSWIYYPGQRRVRRSPAVDFDNPNSEVGGLSVWDQSYTFNGSLERYNWELIGKKEFYIPYNCYKAEVKAEPEELFKGGHPNPDYARWELHRVWVVEAKLKEGERHIFHRRLFYFDEDSWFGVAADHYDAEGALYRSSVDYTINAYDLPGLIYNCEFFFDYQTWQYAVFLTDCLHDRVWKYDEWPKEKEAFFTPENMRRQAIR